MCGLESVTAAGDWRFPCGHAEECFYFWFDGWSCAHKLVPVNYTTKEGEPKAFVTRMGLVVMAFLLMVACSGCMTTAMKGTPFYTGEYSKRVGPADQRVNLWPVCYYRDPALSVIWPVFELTDDHTAVRPVFSVYGLDQTNREYNFLWPYAQVDRQSGDNHFFPFFWSKKHTVVFPVYWHYGHLHGTNVGTDSLFPVWWMHREGTNKLTVLSPWPIAGVWHDTKMGETGGMILPLCWYDKDRVKTLFLSPVWMEGMNTNGGRWRLVPFACFQSSNAHSSALVTPLWSQGKTGNADWRMVTPLCYWDCEQHTLLSPLWARWENTNCETYFSPAFLTWMRRKPQCDDLWMAGGLARASWGEKAGAHYVFPLYLRNASRKMFLSPLFGWREEGDAFFYPLTPLAGIRSGDQSGYWMFPVFSHKVHNHTNDMEDRFLILSGRDRTTNDCHSWFFPLFSFHDRGPLDRVPSKEHAVYGKEFWSLPFCWYEHQRGYWAAKGVLGEALKTNGAPIVQFTGEPEYRFKHGIFPLYSFSTNSHPNAFTYSKKGSFGVILYDYKHERGPLPAKDSTALNDYTRARILWRLWHYERLNGDVGVDVFPGVTYDRKKNGFKKVSVFWRFYRYERSAKGKTKMDVFFVSVRR